MTGNALCLAHLDAADRATYLATLSAGHEIDHRGTEFSRGLLQELFGALRNSEGRPCFGMTRFDGAVFSTGAQFRDVTFSAGARFKGAVFSATAEFDGAVFAADAWFSDATFAADAWFKGATFCADAQFDGVVFAADAWFSDVTFSAAEFRGATFAAKVRFRGATFAARTGFRGTMFSTDAGFDGATFATTVVFNGATFAADAGFEGVTFGADAWFDGVMFCANVHFRGAVFSARAWFSDATFAASTRLGPLRCQGPLDLSGTAFEKPVTVEAAAMSVICVRTRWESTATLRLRYATVDLSDAVITQPIAVTAHPAPFTMGAGVLDESALTGSTGVRVASLRGVDAAHLVLTNTDLTQCRFFGAFHLDQLRLEGETVFARTPPGSDVRRGIPLRWTDRLTLAEEHDWRTMPHYRRRLRAGWTAPARSGPAVGPPGPAALAALYRQLRKAFEDGKDEPGAADFYYGEMEMRRLDRRARRKRAERGLLTAYWMLSGYGLRASRALAWLGLAMTATVIAIMFWGLPADDLKQESTGQITGQNIRLTTDTPTPVNPSGPLHERVTAKRFEKSLRVVVNSVIFRSSGQNLTTSGTYTEMAARLTEPVLLGFAALAIRGRVKR